jgi:hypothetical protein
MPIAGNPGWRSLCYTARLPAGRPSRQSHGIPSFRGRPISDWGLKVKPIHRRHSASLVALGVLAAVAAACAGAPAHPSTQSVTSSSSAPIAQTPATPRPTVAASKAPSPSTGPTPVPTASPAPKVAPMFVSVVEDSIFVAGSAEVFRGSSGDYHWTDVDVIDGGFTVRWNAVAASNHSCKFAAWFDAHPKDVFRASVRSAQSASANRWVTAVTQGGLTVRTDCTKWIVKVVPATYSQSYWYCWDSGKPRPHHLGHWVSNDHFCSDEELVRSGMRP